MCRPWGIRHKLERNGVRINPSESELYSLFEPQNPSTKKISALASVPLEFLLVRFKPKKYV
jgi:hypothetical protein